MLEPVGTVCEMEVPEEYMEDAIDCGQNGCDVRVPSYQEVLNSIDQDPIKVGNEDTEKEVEMNLVAETPHLSELKSVSWLDAGGEISPKVEEDENSNHEGDDGHSVPQKEDEDLPLTDSLHLQIQWMVQAVSVVCIIIPGTVTHAQLADVV